MHEDAVAEEVPAEQPKKRSLASQFLQRGRLLAFAVAIAVELTIFFGAMVYPIDPTQQTALLNQANNLLNASSGQGAGGVFSSIFENNVRVALLEMIPAAGAVLFGASIFTTGQVIQALAISSHLPGPVFGLALFIFPFSVVELAAYAIAVASGTMLIVAWRRKRLAIELPVFLAEAFVVVAAVLVAAVMETAGIVSPIISLALWVPTALAIVALAFYIRGRHG